MEYTPSTILPPLEGTTKFGGTQSRIIMGGVNVLNVGTQYIPCLSVIGDEQQVLQLGLKVSGDTIMCVSDPNTQLFVIDKTYSLLNDNALPSGTVVATGVTGEAITYDPETGVVTGITVTAFAPGTAYWCKDVIRLADGVTIYLYEPTTAGRTIREVWENLQHIISANILRPNLEGVTFVEGEETDDVGKILADNTITSVESNSEVAIRKGAFISRTNLKSVNFPNATSIGATAFSYCAALQSASFPNATSIGDTAFASCSSLKLLELPKITDLNHAIYDCQYIESVYAPLLRSSFGNTDGYRVYRLIDFEFGVGLNISLNIIGWNPSIALSDNTRELVPQEILDEHPDWWNKDYLLYNIRRHIAANLPDRTGLTSLTLTFSSNVKSAINGSAETLQMFMDKNWTIA